MSAPSATSDRLTIAMLSIHSSPVGPLGTRDTGGMSVYVSELAKWLGRDGHRVDIFTNVPGRNRPLFPNVRLIHLNGARGRGIDKERLPAYLPGIFDALEAHRRAERRDYDMIHSHYWLSGVVGALAHARWHRPHVTMFHTLAMLKNHTRSGEAEPDLRIAHERRLAKTVDHIVVPTPREMENLTRFYHARPSKIRIIPCGVNLELFKPINPIEARRRLGLPGDAPIVLYVGRFAPLKGIDRLIEAVALLKGRSAVAPRLVIVGGDGPEARETRQLKALAAQTGVDAQVHFAGRLAQERLPLYYSAADLLAFCSHYESFGLVVLEALACGTPVVATPVGVVDAIVREGVNGKVIASAATADVADGIAWVLERLSTEATARQAVVRATVEPFGWHHVAAAMADLYAAAIQAHAPSPADLAREGFALPST